MANRFLAKDQRPHSRNSLYRKSINQRVRSTFEINKDWDVKVLTSLGFIVNALSKYAILLLTLQDMTSLTILSCREINKTSDSDISEEEMTKD